MKKLIFLTGLGLISLYSQGLCPYIGPDIQLPCGTNSTTLTADFSNCPPGGPNPLETTSYGLLNIPYAPSPNVGTNIPLTDDSQAGPFPIGFLFCFFGNTYNQVYVGSNGWVSFSAGQSTSWSCATIPIPTANACVPKNCVMGPYFDFTPSGGNVRYQTQGVAPCRKFVVSWVNVASFSCGGTNNIQIVLYESTNIIEVHIGNKNACPGWNSGAGTEGLHNLPGTIAYVVPGRNASNWNTVNNSYRWTPTGAPVPVTYNWYQVGNPVPIGTGLTITVTPPAGGADYTCHPEYSVCYDGYMTCMGFGGVNGPDTINVIPGPPNIFPTILPPYSFCLGDTLQLFTDQTYNNYLWSNGSTDTSILISNPGPISVDVVDMNGCIGTATAIINQYPNPILNIIPDNPEICLGETIQMTANGALNYIWSPSSTLDNPNSNIVNASPTTNTLYTVVGIDINGCVDSVTNNIIVNLLPNINITATDTGLCLNGVTTLNANGALNYIWSPSSTLTNPNNSITNASPNTNTTYQVIGEDVNGCKDTATIDIVIYPNPNILFNSNIVSGCSPITVNFNNLSNTPYGSIVSYIWNTNNQSYNNQNPIITYTNPGVYDVQLIAISDMGCSDTLSMINYVNVYSNPIAGFTYYPTQVQLSNSTTYFTNTSTNNAVNFNWNFSGLGSSSFSNPSFTFSYADTFDITLVVSTVDGCYDTIINELVVKNLNEIWIPNSFTPNSDNINNNWFPVYKPSENSVILVEVYNRWGQLIFESSTKNTPWTGVYNNQICEQGVYSYKVYYKNEVGKEHTYYGHINLIR
jgi:gliding motility-associated-like protein